MFRRIFVSFAAVAVALLCASAVVVNGQDKGDIDWNRARQIHQRVQKGEKVSDEDRAYLERAKQLRQGAGKGASPPARLPVGLKPLTDMTADNQYKGQDGGLYGGGKNDPPDAHLKAALQLAGLIRPLDAGGKPAENGKIGLVSIGMSNTTQEFSAFMDLASRDSRKSRPVVLVDGAQGGMEAQAWAQMDRPWEALEQRLRQTGVAAPQVQVVWMKQARRSPASLGEFPKHTDEMNGHIVVILRKLKERFTNLRIVYLSSRIYAGYARSNLNPEPYAYESAFAVRSLIQDQIKGSASLNFDPAKGKVVAPLLLWGPYLWADGEQGRKLDDLVWKPDDLGPDGTHPSSSGRRKVAEQLLHFFETDPTAKAWFVAMSGDK